uniref:Transposase, putative n=1 Tax=Medicago truncatula TaxID=3880 RepID=A4PRI3_MEDTR|nr:transposase, putative [Medicago truncatula]
MEIEDKERPVPPKKPTNQENPIMFNDTPVKANTEFEDVLEHLDDLLLLDEI